jgi:hypothetical protein
MEKPNIVNVIGGRVKLVRAGKEWVGLCPFHKDRRPSLYVNEWKEVFLCRACGEKGNAIQFVMKLDGLIFSRAKAALRMGIDYSPPPLTATRKRAAEVAAAWVNEQRAKFNVLIAETMEDRDLAEEIGDSELAEIFDRELVMLRGFYDALKHPRGAAELLAVRESIEQITAEAEIIHEAPPPFPPLTPEYVARLKEIPLDFERCFR